MGKLTTQSIEVTVSGKQKKSSKWRKFSQSWFTVIMVLFTAFEVFMAGYNVAKHYHSQAVSAGILAVAFGGLVIFQILDMALDARMGRHASRMNDELFEAFEAIGNSILQPENGKRPAPKKK